MSADRELLELAAKAAGISVEYRVAGQSFIGDLKRPAAQTWRGPLLTGTEEEWDPLTNDGDSRRLQVVCGLRATCDEDRACSYLPGASYPKSEKYSDHAGDKCAALRMAVLRAAAEIGRAKP